MTIGYNRKRGRPQKVPADSHAGLPKTARNQRRLQAKKIRKGTKS